MAINIICNELPELPGFSHAYIANGFMFTSGMVSCEKLADRKLRVVGPNDPDWQTRETLDRLGILLKCAGMTFRDVVKTTIFFTRMEDYAAISRAYWEHLKAQGVHDEEMPARSAVQVAGIALLGALVEIEMIARVPQK